MKCVRCGRKFRDYEPVYINEQGLPRLCQACAEKRVAFTRLEYIEFTDSDECERFAALPPVTDEEIRRTDVDLLARLLQGRTP